jgi:hypothetical protein
MPVLTIDVQKLDVDLLVYHELQEEIRPWSEKYQTYVHDDQVDLILASMESRAEQGLEPFDPHRAVFVRALENGQYEVFSGWTRTTAVREYLKSGKECDIYCDVRENVTEAQVAIEMASTQGKELDVWAKARHAYYCCSGDDPLMGVRDYARQMNIDSGRVAHWMKAAEFDHVLRCRNGGLLDISVSHAEELAGLNAEEGEWFVQRIKTQNWSHHTLRRAVEAFKSITVPDELKHWLDEAQWKKDAADDAADEQTTVGSKFKRIIEKANQEKSWLAEKRQVWLFDKAGIPFGKTWYLQERFLEQLPIKAKPNESQLEFKIKQIALDLNDEVRKLDEKFQRYQQQQLDSERQQQLEAERQKAILEQEKIYAPVGINDSVTKVDLGVDRFDAAFIWYDLEYDHGWRSSITQTIKDGGFLVAVVSDFNLVRDIQSAMTVEHDFPQCAQLVWVNPANENVDKDLIFNRDIQYVCVFRKGFSDYYDGSGAVRMRYKNDRISCIISDPKNPMELAEYLMTAFVPDKGNILEPYAQYNAVFSRVSKARSVRSTFLIEDKKLFDQANQKIQETSFSWE